MAQSATSYLSRAARQPVKWQPWGRDAFILATKLDRPVLLYVGGDSCRWCVETDRAIYSDPEIGTMINTLFVPIRVDRDERPEIAQRYQSAVERLAGLRGWPLTVFLTTDGAPFFGGTYFPADDPVTGRGMKQLLPEVARSYHDQHAVIVQRAELIRRLMLSEGEGSADRAVLRPAFIQSAVIGVRDALAAAVENRSVTGSVVSAAAVSLLLSASARARDSLSLAIARRALYLMLDTSAANAGEAPPRLVRAALVGVLAQAWVVTGDRQFREAGRALMHAVARDLRFSGAGLEPAGVFADQEGYVIDAVLLAAATLGDAGAEERAQSALDGLLQRAYARGWGVRHSVGAVPRIPTAITARGLLQDQVQVASACLAAHQITGERRYLDVAIDLVALLDRSYADSLGGYFDTAAPTPPASLADVATPAFADRTKHALDDLLPGPNAVAAQVLSRLAQVTGNTSYRRSAEATLEAFAASVPGNGLRAATFLSAARETLVNP
jgi:uncharacterized protein YyaL (SSP411 family)